MKTIYISKKSINFDEIQKNSRDVYHYARLVKNAVIKQVRELTGRKLFYIDNLSFNWITLSEGCYLTLQEEIEKQEGFTVKEYESLTGYYDGNMSYNPNRMHVSGKDGKMYSHAECGNISAMVSGRSHVQKGDLITLLFTDCKDFNLKLTK